MLLFAFLVQRAGTILLDEVGQADAAVFLRYAWLGLVAYTWVAPGIFDRMVRKEMASFRLRSDF